MATLYESYITGDDGNIVPYGVYYRAQMFTPSVAHTITSVKLLLYRLTTPGTLTISIRATDGDGKPTGSDLCSGTTSGDTLPTASPYEWREITLGNGTLLLANIKYAIVAANPDGDGQSEAIYWRTDASSPTYTGGSLVSSSDSGVTWGAPDTTRDMMFYDYGDPPAAIALTLNNRSLEMTLALRSPSMTLNNRSLEMTLPVGRI